MEFVRKLFLLSTVVYTSLFLFSCSGFGDIDIGDIEDVKLKRLSGRTIEFEVLLTIDNPTSFRYRITEVDLDVFVNNEFIGNIRNVDNVLIPSRSVELYTFPLRVEFSNILKGALSMFNFFLDRNAAVNVNGTITARSFPFKRTIPVNESTDVELNRP